MSHFEKINGSLSLFLTHDEAEILINLSEQLLELLGEGNFFHHYDTTDPLAQLFSMPAAIETPDDPVLLRLLPNAYSDPEAASDFRRYTEPDLRSGKQRNQRMVREQLLTIVDENLPSGVILDIDPQVWLLAINDIKLALAVRLDVDADSYEKFDLLPDEDPNKPIFAVYFWLGWLQENLLSTIR